MPTTVQVEARVLGRRKQNLQARPLELDDGGDVVTLADLIASVVRAEVREFLLRQDEQRLIRFLTEVEMSEAAAAGKVSTGRFIDEDHMAAATRVDEERAVANALLAYTDGLFQVVVDGAPVDDLAAPVALTEGCSLMFLRLVALAGG